MKLTANTIRTLTLPPGVIDKVFFDADLPGFGVRVRASGVYSWMIQYAIAGRTRRVVLGLVGALDPGKARAIAKDLLAQVRLGRDPAAEKDRAKARAAETFGALLPRFLERQRVRLKPRSYVEAERHLVVYAKALHGLPVESIVRRTIATRLAEIEKRSGPATRNRARASLSAYFTWLAREGYIDVNPVTYTNLAAETGARDRVPSDDELRTIWLALDDDHYGAILKLLMLTGARRNEIADLTWDEVDPDEAIITLSPKRTKNKREHIVVLSEPALAILQAQPRRIALDGTPRKHVFGIGSSGFQGWTVSRRRLDARIAEANHGKALEQWTPHDFRRSLSTALHERFGVPPHVVETVLGHVGGHRGGVAGTYNRALYLDERRRALERWGAHIMGLVTGERAQGRVVDLHERPAVRKVGPVDGLSRDRP
jgi:integrase